MVHHERGCSLARGAPLTTPQTHTDAAVQRYREEKAKRGGRPPEAPAPQRHHEAPRGRREPWDVPEMDTGQRHQHQTAWADAIRVSRWSFWIRLSWAVPVGAYRASQHVERWANRLRARLPGCALVVGYHVSPTGRRHAHALLSIPRQGAPRTGGVDACLVGVARHWHQTFWPQGDLWLDVYRPWRVGGEPHRRGAPWYLTEAPGTVEQYGQPVPYTPRRQRR